VFSIAVKGGATSLVSFPVEQFGEMPPSEIASRIAASNQDTLSHFICQQFVDGGVPVLSGQPEADEYYNRMLENQTGLLSYLDSEFRTLPRSVGNSGIFVASGALVLRTQVFGIPNVMDRLAARGGFELTNAQHRRGLDNTWRKSLVPYYLPITHVSVGVNRQLVDDKTMELRPEAWRHNGNPDDFMAYPDPAIVSAVNQSVQDRRERGERMAGQTGCPAFHSRVPLAPEVVDVVPLPRSLPEMGLNQLDRWYYPNRAAA
jgi:hypothetical protein